MKHSFKKEKRLEQWKKKKKRRKKGEMKK